MSCPTKCNNGLIFKFKPISYGISAPLYVQPMSRVNGQHAALPRGFNFADCQIPCKEDCPVPVTIGNAPVVNQDASIPTAAVGVDNFLLGQPSSWIAALDENGDPVVIPAYTPAP